MFKATFLLLLLLIFYGSATLAQTGRNMEREKEIWAELETFAPNSVADFKLATEAMDAQNYEQAIDLFLKVNQRAPRFDAALRRLGGCLLMTGKKDAGFAFMEKALAIRRSPENLFSLAHSLVYPGVGSEGTREQKSRALELLKEANRSPQPFNDPDSLVLQAQLAMD